MKKFSLLSLFFCLIAAVHLFASNGDTTVVTSHSNVYVVTNPNTGTNPYPLWAVFPSASTQYRKIILTLSHKCPPGLPCGEWDYIDNVFIRRVGGMNAASADIEVARYITPYGSSFNSSWGSSWTLDATDYASLLHDSVEIEYIHTGYETNINKGWSVSVSFSLIEGTPVMPPIAFHQLWKGSFPFGNAADPIENYLPADTILVDANAANLKLKITQSGHGSDNAGCSEFCSKNRSVYFDGALVNTKAVWRLCGRNPIYPQGGTWVYDRANWCPGNWVYPVNYKFNVTGGTTHIVDMNMQTYSIANPSANFVIDAQLYEFGALSNANDAEIDEVMEPSSKFEFSRMNPVCNNPRIRIKNNGSNPITSATFKYGMVGTTPVSYSWTGNLASLDTVQIVFPGIITPLTGSQTFQVYIETVNGGADQYAYDDTAYTTALINPILDTTFVINFKTNAAPSESSYKLWDENGNIVAQRLQGSMTANTVYKDTFYVAQGCYRFKFFDSGDDGLQWWANPGQGSGYARISRTNVATQYVTFNADFGSEISYNFRAVPGGTVGIDDDIAGEASLSIYPNPSQGKLSVDIALSKPGSVTVDVLNQVGQIVSTHYEKKYTTGIIDLDLSKFDNGVYVVRLKADDITKTEKIILQH